MEEVISLYLVTFIIMLVLCQLILLRDRVSELRKALNSINNLAPAMHEYSELEYGMVMIAREALKND